MSETLSILPFSFWVVIAFLVGGGVWSFRRMNDGTGLPMLVVLGTAAAWYVGDAFYNDYAKNHAKLFDAGTLSGAWWQVAWFLAVFLVMTPPTHQWLNRRYLQRHSGVMQLFKQGVDQPEIQKSLNALFRGCASVWIILFVIAVVILKTEIIYYLFPFLGHSATPWSHGRIGAGLDFLDIFAVYLQLLVAAMFGVVAALATDPRIRRFALFLILLTWPYFIFDRTRNSMLAITIPAVLSWVFLRLRGGMWKKIVVLLAVFLVVNTWMKFIIANRGTMNITAAFEQKGLDLADQKKVHNEGLNMFEELCWVSTFIDKGTYHVNWGARYFAELVNPIPRALWPGKPLIGIDYAIARGMQYGSETDASGVVATVSTGFIGQGVVNFGRFFGPMAAALLMCLWVAALARLDLNIHALGRLPLYSLGMILTFNLGRDITLITLYPFLFCAMAVWWIDRRRPQVDRREATATAVAQPVVRRASGQRLPFARRLSSGGFVKRKSSGSAMVHSQTGLKKRSVTSDSGHPST
jgi:ABC-type multidrug transport system fused ATPase/permease subunit